MMSRVFWKTATAGSALALMAACTTPPMVELTGTVKGKVVLAGAASSAGAQVTGGGRAATTDDDGSFELPDLSAGDVVIRASAPGFVGQEATVTVVADATVEKDFALAAVGSKRTPMLVAVASPPVVRRGGTLVVEAMAEAFDGGALTYGFSASTGWVVAIDGAVATVTAPAVPGASGTVTVTATDSAGNEAVRTVRVATADNLAPVIHGVLPPATEILPNTAGAAEASAADPDGDTLEYVWTLPAGWTVVGTGPAVAFRAPMTNPDSSVLAGSMTVNDGFGGTASVAFRFGASACSAGVSNCDGEVANGCETRTSYDSANCGGCGVVCAAGAVCGGGACLTAPGDFRIGGLTAQNCQSVDHDALTGDDRGGIGLSASSVFYSGDTQTARYAAGDLTGGTALELTHETMISDVLLGRVFIFADANGPATSGTVADRLVELDGTTGAVTATVLMLSTPITLGGAGSTGIFAGALRGAVWTGGQVYEINLLDGTVTDRGALEISAFRTCETWAFWGMAEYFDGQLQLAYVESSELGSFIVRRRVSDGAREVISTFTDISDMCSFVASPAASRWYWHHEGSSELASGSEMLGYCDASFN